MKNPLWFIIWLVILVIVAFPVGFFCAGWYVLLYPLTVCIPAISVSIPPTPTLLNAITLNPLTYTTTTTWCFFGCRVWRISCCKARNSRITPPSRWWNAGHCSKRHQRHQRARLERWEYKITYIICITFLRQLNEIEIIMTELGYTF